MPVLAAIGAGNGVHSASDFPLNMSLTMHTHPFALLLT
jgi:hypothetical protein